MVRFNLLKTFGKVVLLIRLNVIYFVIIIIFKIAPIEPSSEPTWCRKTRPNCCEEYTKETCTEYCNSNPCNGRGSN